MARHPALIMHSENVVVHYNDFILCPEWLAQDDPLPLLVIDYNIGKCGMCDETIYIPCHTVSHHVFTTHDAVTCSWVSKDFNTLIHQCGEDISAQFEPVIVAAEN